MTYNFTTVGRGDPGSLELFTEADLCEDLCNSTNFFSESQYNTASNTEDDLTCDGDCDQDDVDI